ncbi:hypothetical protein UYSO10_2856 [Kosakonia radicincitans]|nr:hypothetical protein UYSO10_2856 [Kosakonia radicincitans]
MLLYYVLLGQVARCCNAVPQPFAGVQVRADLLEIGQSKQIAA